MFYLHLHHSVQGTFRNYSQLALQSCCFFFVFFFLYQNLILVLSTTFYAVRVIKSSSFRYSWWNYFTSKYFAHTAGNKSSVILLILLIWISFKDFMNWKFNISFVHGGCVQIDVNKKTLFSCVWKSVMACRKPYEEPWLKWYYFPKTSLILFIKSFL